MNYAVKVSEAAMQALRESAQLHNRSISGQAEHWLQLGRAFERDPRFGFTKIEQALQGLIDPDQLDEADQDVYFDRLTEKLQQPSPLEDKFFAALREQGEGVGLDENDQLIYTKATSQAP